VFSLGVELDKIQLAASAGAACLRRFDMTAASDDSWNTPERAELALQYAVAALADAEIVGCGDDEIEGLCDEVIRRRLRLRMTELVRSQENSAAVAAQLTRDRLLLSQGSGVAFLLRRRDSRDRIVKIPPAPLVPHPRTYTGDRRP
jgi:hypothetical protein